VTAHAVLRPGDTDGVLAGLEHMRDGLAGTVTRVPMGTTVAQSAETAQRAASLAPDGAAVAREGGEAVREMVATMHGIEQSSRRIADISCASAEQRDGIAQMSKAVAAIDATTQQNAARVEQSAAAGLRRRADARVETVASFRVA